MTSETFTFQRFWNYFKYDLKQLWHNNGKAAVLLGFISVICYLIWVLGSLVFSASWNAPGPEARIMFFILGSIILMFYQTKTYGYLTEKRPGQAWLMIPASTLEKFISMMIITIIVIPCAYVVSYLVLDSLIALLDPTAGQSILMGVTPLAEKISTGLSAASEEGYQFHLGLLAFPLLIQQISNFLYFLLCGISFKKWKIVGSLAIMLALSAVITPLFSLISLHTWAPMLASYGSGDDPVIIANFVNNVMNWSTVINSVIMIGLAIGIYFRIKTLKH